MPTPITWTPQTVAASTVDSTHKKQIGPAAAGVKASRVLTFTGAGANGDPFTITGPIGGAIVYTLRTAPTNSTPYEVLIGVDATATATNSKNAILGTGSGFSTATPTNLDVTAASTAGALTVTATFGGTAGNSIAVEESGTSASWAGATLTGGVDPDILIPDWAQSFTVCNPSAKSFVGIQAAPPTELIYLTPDTTDVDSGYLVTGIGPRTVTFRPDFPPIYYVHSPEVAAIPFSVIFS